MSGSSQDDVDDIDIKRKREIWETSPALIDFQLERDRSWLSDFLDLRSTKLPVYQEMSAISHAVLEIVQQLCKRDGRFAFIQSALEELHDAPYGLNTHLELLSAQFDPVLTIKPSYLWSRSDIAAGMAVWRTKLATNKLPNDPIDRLDLDHVLREIVDSAIFELLYIFDFHIDNPPSGKFETPACILDCFSLLQNLYEKSRSLEPKQSEATLFQQEPRERDIDSYEYSSLLDSVTGQIRVLEILPGVEEDPIECRLVVCNLYDDSIAEALSYVWGIDTSQIPIRVDHRTFLVRKNLHGILRQLRRGDAVRTIWVDAICINQSDNKEKTHQVRLMRDIYSRAQCTIVWLGGISLQNHPVPDGPFHKDEYYAPLPTGFGGTTMNEYDLCAILNEIQRHPQREPYGEKDITLFMMLQRCIDQVLSHEWWERIWTLQEAILPPKAPIFFCHNYFFTFDDLVAGVELVKEYAALGTEHAHPVPNLDIGDELREHLYAFCRARRSLELKIPLILHLRPGLETNREPVLKSLVHLLSLTDTYRASNALDKIFALESLLPRYTGRLINVNYDESCEVVFRRITARYCNAAHYLALFKHYKFLFESPLHGRKTINGPSWVLDFTYSDASVHSSKSAGSMIYRATLDGFIFRNKMHSLQEDEDRGNTHYATPKILFCSGRCVDRICTTGLIPSLGDREPKYEFVSFLSNLYALRPIHSRKFDGQIDERTAYSDEKFSSTIFPLFGLFALFKGSPRNITRDSESDPETLLKSRYSNLVGKTYFITSQGIVGISTAPVKHDDVLVRIYTAPVYLILEEIETGKGKSTAPQQHRIVARAAIAEDLDDTKVQIDSAPEQPFRIV
ncbi:HET-domain-containing protein [Xylaria acuta]|nr:HET-domain-containing protein [Xylaria acuta]